METGVKRLGLSFLLVLLLGVLVGCPMPSGTGGSVQPPSGSGVFFNGPQRGLYSAERVGELYLFLLAQSPQPLLLVPVNDRAEVPGDLPSRVGQLDQEHAPIGTMRRPFHVTAPFK